MIGIQCYVLERLLIINFHLSINQGHLSIYGVLENQSVLFIIQLILEAVVKELSLLRQC